MVLIRRLHLVALSLLAWAGVASGGTYADPSGFSFTYPDGWFPVSRAAIGDVRQAMPAEVKDWASRNSVDLNQVAVFLVRNGRGQFLENLNVVVVPQQIPTDGASVGRLTAELPQQYAALGANVSNVQGRVQRVGSRDAVVMDYLARMPGTADQLRQRQVMFPGGGKTFVVTCTGTADSFVAHQPTFDAILASFQAPAPAATGFDWSQVLRTSLVGGIIGGLAGGIGYGVKKLSGKPKPKPKRVRHRDEDEDDEDR